MVDHAVVALVDDEKFGVSDGTSKLKVQGHIARLIRRKVVQGGKSRAGQIGGPPGVGKSTLFNCLKDSIEEERVAQGKLEATPNYLSPDVAFFRRTFRLFSSRFPVFASYAVSLSRRKVAVHKIVPS